MARAQEDVRDGRAPGEGPDGVDERAAGAEVLVEAGHPVRRAVLPREGGERRDGARVDRQLLENRHARAEEARGEVVALPSDHPAADGDDGRRRVPGTPGRCGMPVAGSGAVVR